MNDVATATAVAPAPEGKQVHPMVLIKDQIEKREHEFARALPAHIPVERFKRVVLTAVQNNPDLLRADRQSFFNACMRSAQDGLLPDGRDGAIVIYSTKERRDGRDEWIKKAQWMPMVFGILKKIRNSGELAAITARVVYAGDRFRYWIDDSGEHVEYEPADNPDTNVVRRVFAMAKTKGGEVYVEPMSVEQIEKVRNVSRAKDKGPWVDWWDQMAIKTALRRLAKRLPMSSDLDDLLRRDDDLYDMQGASDQTVKGPRPSLVASLDRLAAPTPAVPSPADAEEAVTDETDTTSSDSAPSAAAPSANDADEAPAADSSPVGERAPATSDDEDDDTRAAAFLAQCRAHIASVTDADALSAWFRSAEQRDARMRNGLSIDEIDDLQAAAKARATVLRKQVED